MIVRNHYQELFDLIQPFLPTGWKSIVIYAEYGVSSYSIEFFIKTATGNIIKCFNIPGIDEDALLDAFDKMNDVIVSQRSDLPKTSLWTNATITVDISGKMSADFDYTDLSENGYAYKQAWKAKYLA